METNLTNPELNKIADEFAEQQLSLFPLDSPHIPSEWIERIRDVVRGYSYAGFKKGYLKALEDQKNIQK